MNRRSKLAVAFGKTIAFLLGVAAVILAIGAVAGAVRVALWWVGK